ncbi:carbohydrate-binding protein [Streptomyces sp. NPDC056910]|uniref:carbohydrate-binding protein n=1 Tax=Streptomyces sp. NPDC056910 TaxID=3345964 RepID=UPI00369F34A1
MLDRQDRRADHGSVGSGAARLDAQDMGGRRVGAAGPANSWRVCGRRCADAPDGKLPATTRVPNTGDRGTYQATPAVPVDALTGRDKLSLVFKSPQDNVFDVDAVQFSNP